MEELNLYILTSNCARNLIDVDLFAAHFFDVLPTSTPAPELIVLSLQELAPIAYSFLGGSYLLPYFNAFIKAVKQATAKQWNKSYVELVKDHTGMTGLMVFARADIAGRISWIDTAHVGFGLQDMGNKGAVGARLKYVVEGRSSQTADLTFVAAHLAPMEDGLVKRNLDWQSIVERLVFPHGQGSPRTVEGDGQHTDESTSLLNERANSSSHNLFAPNSYLFLAGDLNYRTSDVSPLKEDLIRFPKRYADPSSPSHYSHLLPEDQLIREMRAGRTFHGLFEAPINFPPTYKFSDAAQQDARRALETGDSDTEWKWSSHRWPSWCDRILYLDDAASRDTSDGAAHRTVKPVVYDALPLFPHSDHRPVALAVSVPLRPTAAPEDADHMAGDANGGGKTGTVAPFAIDPTWRSRRDAARRKEIVVGVLAYLGLTWEGNGMVLASVVGLLGAWAVLRSIWGV
ncbi:uncharacterized protein N7496_004235 [Penicillium cataractarum]|uniref:Inositol polyphosphate-related phosphatase domain-containing protein n=1 Tax=Penicillium cataractarum TaxID=2100454 RepID=A0A9W9VH70_9EURO|nr:uncharacterized protein N7496_004235 [Penicillium cataractarum]KAJ5381807.1 hypothetical protein N7496_004235 [Penicillium cataractarum]